MIHSSSKQFRHRERKKIITYSSMLILVNSIKLTKYLTKLHTKNKWNRCQREYVYRDELPLYKVKENVNQRQKKQMIISDVVVVI